MTQEELFSTLKAEFIKIVNEHNVQSEKVEITGRALSPQEAIGVTERRDFPILTGKELMLQAEFMGSKGQAFTDAPALYSGTLQDVINMDLEKDAHARGLFIATMNAVLCHLGVAQNTVHCKNGEPERCAEQALAWVQEQYGSEVRIALVGYQPALLEQLASKYKLRVLDLNPDNIGQMRYGVKVEDGMDYKEVCGWADLVLCTGSTICNGTIVNFLNLEKELVFFGTTISAAAKILGLKRMCFCSL
ncbi:MAG: DUF364 domain-containing protein [Oscillospiraceae bacterium]